MRLSVGTICFAAVFVARAAGQPAISGIFNGASFVPAGLPNGNIAQGSIFSIFGTRLGPAASPPLSFPLERTLGGVKVHVAPLGTSSSTDAIPLYVGPGQINALLPSSVPVGPMAVTVEYPAGRFSSMGPITVVQSSPGLFTANQGGSGQAAALNVETDKERSLNAINEAVHPGQSVELWGTGLGPVGFDETQPPEASDMTAKLGVEVFVAGRAITPLYAGRSPQFAGVDQITIALPAGIVTGCYVPITVRANGVISNTASLAIASGTDATCSDELTALPASFAAEYSVGTILLSGSNHLDLEMPIARSAAAATFEKVEAADIAMRLASFGVSVYGACAAYTYRDQSPLFQGMGYLDAGPELTLTGPGKGSKTLRPIQKGEYWVTGIHTGPILGLGNYTISNGNGGADVKGFAASITVPQVLTWTNRPSLHEPPPVQRDSGYQVTWTGADPGEAVVIMGWAARGRVGAGFYCLATGTDGQFTVAPEVLSALPPTTFGAIGIAQIPTASKAVVRNPPEGLDVLMFTYKFETTTPIGYQ
jgi:uncharacterized protein (TIGR03437 family)